MPASHSRRATRALARLTEVDPALASLSLWCRHRDIDDGISAKSDASTVFYGTLFELLSLPEQVGLAAHHVLHIALRHVPRQAALQARFGAGFDARLFNVAADAIVNDVLSAAGHVLPRPFLTIHGVLDAVMPVQDDDKGVLQKLDAERLYLRLRASTDASGKRSNRGNTGQAQSAQERLDRYVAAQAFSEDLSENADSFAPDNATQDQNEWRMRLARALETGRAAGKGIGSTARDIMEFRPADTPWEVHLRRLVSRAVMPGLAASAFVPSRRWLAAHENSRRSETPSPGFERAYRKRIVCPRIAVAIDTSGSIDDARLTLFATQIAAIGQRVGAELHVVSFDDDVHDTVRLNGANWAGEIKRLSMTGGGGTSFGPPVAAAKAMSASLLVVLTDLLGEFGDAPGDFPVLWAVPDASVAPKPPFGKVVDLAA